MTKSVGNNGHFAMVPRIVLFSVRDPYDLMLWVMVRDIAGENGKCETANSTLSRLMGISASKIAKSIEFLIHEDLLIGKKIKKFSHSSEIWSLSFPNSLWGKNQTWSTNHPQFEDRIGYKESKNSDKSVTIICQRCLKNKQVKTGHSKRCTSCQDFVNSENENIYKKLGKIKRFLKKDVECASCTSVENLELHLDETLEEPVIFCEHCHDAFHRREMVVESENMAELNHLSGGKLAMARDCAFEDDRLTEGDCNPQKDSAAEGNRRKISQKVKSQQDLDKLNKDFPQAAEDIPIPPEDIKNIKKQEKKLIATPEEIWREIIKELSIKIEEIRDDDFSSVEVSIYDNTFGVFFLYIPDADKARKFSDLINQGLQKYFPGYELEITEMGF